MLSGGRGLGTFKNGFKGGVHLATTLAEVKRLTENMLGQKLVTKQSVRWFFGDGRGGRGKRMWDGGMGSVDVDRLTQLTRQYV